MLSKNSLKEILELVNESDGSFVILEGDSPKLAVLDFNHYQKLVNKKTVERVPLPTENPKLTFLVTGAAGILGTILSSQLEAMGHRVVGVDNLSSQKPLLTAGMQNLITLDLTREADLKKLFAENKFDSVFHLAQMSGHNKSWTSPELYFINNVEAGISLLRQMAAHGVNKIVYRSSFDLGTPFSRTKLLFEQILNFYQHAFGINSFSLRLPSLALPYRDQLADLDEALLENPLGAVLATAAGKIPCLPVPDVGEATSDATPRLELLLPEQAIDALVFAFERLSSSSGSLIYRVPGVVSTIGQLIEQTLEITHKMVATTRSHDQIWPREEETDIKSLADIGWQRQVHDLSYLIKEVWGGLSVPVKATAEIGESVAPAPVSLSDLLSGRYIPFIKPHGSN